MTRAVTWKDLETKVQAGYGHGFGESYKAWLYILRGNSSPSSNQIRGPLPGTRRAFNFLSRSEFVIALFLRFLGIREIREQYPLWPWAHDHPLSGLPGISTEQFRALQASPGLYELASHAGIKHGYEVGSDSVPYVATTDLTVAIDVEGVLKFCAIAIKPFPILEDPEIRNLERIELEQIYQANLGQHHAIATQELVGKILPGNLLFFASGSKLPPHLHSMTRCKEFAVGVTSMASRNTINDSKAQMAKEIRITRDDASLLFRWGVWHRLIPIDLTEIVDMNRPIQGDGSDIYSALSRHLLGMDVTSRSPNMRSSK